MSLPKNLKKAFMQGYKVQQCNIYSETNAQIILSDGLSTVVFDYIIEALEYTYPCFLDDYGKDAPWYKCDNYDYYEDRRNF